VGVGVDHGGHGGGLLAWRVLTEPQATTTPGTVAGADAKLHRAPPAYDQSSTYCGDVALVDEYGGAVDDPSAARDVAAKLGGWEALVRRELAADDGVLR
jgi:hypothetical protein